MKNQIVERPTGCVKVVQIHPSRLCNLSCLHCYSSSSPSERGALDAALLCDALDDLADEGYNYAAISGGEPLLYNGLSQVLKHAKDLGFRTAVTTNGILLDSNKLELLDGLVDVLAISLDGVPESHDRIRNSKNAFKKMQSCLPLLRKSGIDFGFIFTLTQYNLDELQWVLKFALKEQAKLLQIHPLEVTGHAALHMVGEEPDPIESAYAYLISSETQKKIGDKIKIQLDMVNRSIFKEFPEKFYGITESPKVNGSLADYLSPLIIEQDGAVVPIQYGFSKQYALGNINNIRLKKMSHSWRNNQLNSFYKLGRRVFEKGSDENHAEFFNWYGMMVNESKTPIVSKQGGIETVA